MQFSLAVVLIAKQVNCGQLLQVFTPRIARFQIQRLRKSGQLCKRSLNSSVKAFHVRKKSTAPIALLHCDENNQYVLADQDIFLQRLKRLVICKFIASRCYAGIKLKKLREKAELSQEALARRIGVTAKTVSYWERGTHLASLTVPQIRLLCQALGVAFGELPDRFGPINDQ